MKKRSIAVTAMFLVLIYGFGLAGLFLPDKTFSETENRLLAKLPQFSFQSLFNGRFTADFETYIVDQFPVRNLFVGTKTIVERLQLKQDINDVYFCQDGYLIDKTTQDKIDTEQLTKNSDRLVDFLQAASQKLGRDHAFAMIAPTAAGVLKDKLPAFAPEYNQDALLDTLAQRLPTGSFIDLRPVFQEHREDGLSYRTDHHWTMLGAYYAYTQWAKACDFEPFALSDFCQTVVSTNFLGTVQSKINLPVAPDSITVFEPVVPQSYQVTINLGEKVTDSLYDPEKLNTKDQYAYFLGGNNPLVQIDSEVKNGKKLLIVKDSYAHCFAPFAANHFESVILLDLRYYKGNVGELMEQNGVTDVLVLYNSTNFAQDKNMTPLRIKE